MKYIKKFFKAIYKALEAEGERKAAYYISLHKIKLDGDK